MAPNIRACLFDMDGLLINSEDLIVRCINDILAEFGRPPLPWSLKAQLQGRTLAQSSRMVLEWADLPITPDEYQSRLQQMHMKWFPTCEPLPGVKELLRGLKDSNVQLALVTSSNRVKFELKKRHLQELFSVFPQDLRILGDDPRIPSDRHKPAPDIYQLALQCVNAQRSAGSPLVSESECLVFEDSIQGVEAGRRAGMQVLWCPHPGLLEEVRSRVDDILYGPIRDGDTSPSRERGDDAIDPGAKSSPSTLTSSQHNDASVRDRCRLATSLAQFDYELYGIQPRCV